MARKRPITKFVLSLVLFVGVAAQAATPAQADMTVSISPVRLEIEAAPGDRNEPQITVSNQGSEAFSVEVGIEQYEGAEIDASAFDWLQIDPSAFDLEPGNSQVVTVSLGVPENLSTGGYYARVAIATRLLDQPEAINPNITTGNIRVGVLVTVLGNGELNVAASVENLVPVLEPDGRVGFRIVVNNEGNLHFTPQGQVEISRDEGTALGSLEIPVAMPLLPANQVVLPAYGTLPLDPGAEFEATVSLDIGTDEPISASTTFNVDAAAEILGMSVCENLDRGPTIQLEMNNQGGLGLMPLLQFSVAQENGQLVGSASPTEPLLLLPDEETSFEANFPNRLLTGDYLLEVQLQYGTEPPIVEELPFAIGGTGPTTIPVCPPASE